MDIEKMQSFVSQVKSLEPSRLTSRKLWITVGSVGILVYLFQTMLPLIVYPVTILIGLYLIVSYLENRDTIKAKTEIKKALIESMTKDGQITPEEMELIEKVN